MDHVWDAFYAVGLTSSPSLTSIPIFPNRCQRNLHEHYEVDPEIIGRGSFASIRRVKLLRRLSNNPGRNHDSGNNNSSTFPCKDNGIYDRYYACKTIPKSNLYDRELFRREVYNLNRCQTNTRLPTNNGNYANNCVIRLLDVIEDRSSVHVVTELCEGGELFDYVRKEHDRTGRGLRGKALSPSTSYSAATVDGDETRCATTIKQILIAFRFLHEDASVCHRDAKASNFVFVKKPSYVAGSLNLRIVDFGLSKFVDGFQEESDYRKSFHVGDKNGATVLGDAPSALDDAIVGQEGGTSSAVLRIGASMWNAFKPTFFWGATDVPACSTTSDDDAAATAAQSEDDTDDDGFRASVSNKSENHSRQESNASAKPPAPIFSNDVDGSCAEDVYSTHYRYMTSEVGTPYYVAPEVLKQQDHIHQRAHGTCNDEDDRNNNGSGYTTKCDIWSIGVLAFLTLTGTLPVIGDDEKETIQKLMDPHLEVDFSDESLWEQDAAETKSGCTNEDNTILKDNGREGARKETPKISNAALRFCKALLQRDPKKRPTAREALRFDWIVSHCDEWISSSSPSSLSSNAVAIETEGSPHQRQHRCLPSLSTSLKDLDVGR